MTIRQNGNIIAGFGGGNPEWGNIDGTLSDQTDLQTALDTKLDTTQISNCITEIPQDIKLELNNGTLTLKAGSKVYVPNGAGVFDSITTSNDFSGNASIFGLVGNGSGNIYVSYDNGLEYLYVEVLNESGTGTPTLKYTTYYNTNDNKVYRYITSTTTPAHQATLSLGRVSWSNSVVTSIDQVFNGFGYIGTTVFALPGVKGLIPNGRNEDGTLKNTEFTTSSVMAQTLSATAEFILYLDSSTFGRSTSTSYYPEQNKVIDTDGYHSDTCIVGNLTQSAATITQLKVKQPFHAVDYNDFTNFKPNGVVNQRDNTTLVKTWTGTKAQYQAIGGITYYAWHSSYDGTLYTTTLSPSVGDTPYYKSGGNFVLDASQITDVGDGWIALLNETAPGHRYDRDSSRDETVSDSSRYDSNTLYNITDDSDVTLTILEALYPVGSIYITTANGCPLSALISGSTWALVSSGRVLQGADSGHSAGTTINAGLPNITANVTVTNEHGLILSDGRSNPTGAFKVGQHTGLMYTNSAYASYVGADLGFDASLSNSIYGNATTVQPPAYVVNIFRRVA